MIFFIVGALCALVPMTVSYLSMAEMLGAPLKVYGQIEYAILAWSFLALAVYFDFLGCLWVLIG